MEFYTWETLNHTEHDTTQGYITSSEYEIVTEKNVKSWTKALEFGIQNIHICEYQTRINWQVM